MKRIDPASAASALSVLLCGAKAISAGGTPPLGLALPRPGHRGANPLCPLCASKSGEEVGAYLRASFLYTVFKI